MSVEGDVLTLTGGPGNRWLRRRPTADAVVHIIDGVLMPGGDTAMSEDMSEEDTEEDG